jgi:hypothetical protein
MPKFNCGDVVYHTKRHLFAKVDRINIITGDVVCFPDIKNEKQDETLNRKWRTYDSQYLVILPEDTPQARLVFILKYKDL